MADPKKALATTGGAPVTKHIQQVKEWAGSDGRHSLDAYLEDVMIQKAQGVDAPDDRSARIAIVAGEEGEKRIVLVSTQRGVVDSIGKALTSGEYKLVGKQAKRPGEEVLAQMLGDAPLPLLPPPVATTAPMPAPKLAPAAFPAKPVAVLPAAKRPTVPTPIEVVRGPDPNRPFHVEVYGVRADVPLSKARLNVSIASKAFRLVTEAYGWLVAWNESEDGFEASARIFNGSIVERVYDRPRSKLQRVS
jgi:hypothetical protein